MFVHGTGVSIVISPLISLIQDQVAGLTALDIPASALSGWMSQGDRQELFQKIFAARAPGPAAVKVR
jgi:superfamily II DNA helicase RecQ